MAEQAWLLHGDALHLPLADGSVDAVVCDPPYGLEFMGKGWDAPWQERGINTDAGFHGGGFTATDTPSYTSSTNSNCLSCGGKRRGRRDGTAIVAVCRCDDPRFPNVRAVEMRAFQAWCEVWAREALRVLKPGGHLLAFGGTRTYHRLTCAIEDAGFEVRDSITWIYGSGFPKSLDVSKAIDRRRDDLADIQRVCGYVAGHRERAGLTNRHVDDAFGYNGMAGHWTNSRGPQAAVPTWEQWLRLRDLLGFGNDMDAEVWRLNGRKGTPGEAWAQREVTGERTTGIGTGRGAVPYIGDGDRRATVAATADAARWSGWGTALKPASEPIVVARKPLAGTVASNVLAHGTGAINIDACRVPAHDAPGVPVYSPLARSRYVGVLNGGATSEPEPRATSATSAGRWPSNVVLSHAATPDGGDLCGDGCVDGCPVADLNRQSGASSSPPVGSVAVKVARIDQVAKGAEQARISPNGHGDSGGASRFFPTFRYEAKAGGNERPRVGGVAHPTVKPVDLMRWLCRLVTPPGGLVLDPFAGSGTTVEAAVVEGFRVVGVERDASYLPLIRARAARARRYAEATRSRLASRREPVATDQGSLFDMLGTDT